jgi:putative ABC transport system permease protein
MTSILSDLRKTLRGLSSNRTFALTVVVTLASGIAAAATIFSVVQAVLVRPVEFSRPGELVHIYFASPPHILETGLYPRDAEFLQRHVKSLSSVALMTASHAIVTGAGEPFGTDGVKVSGNYFSVLGAPPQAGRFLSVADDAAGGDEAVVIGDRIWRSHFGADRRVLGRKIALDGRIHTIVGVAGSQFSSLSNAGFWVPLALTPQQRAEDTVGVVLIGRLAAGVRMDIAAAELQGLSLRHAAELPDREGWFFSAVSIVGERLKDAPQKLRIVTLAALLLLLTACLNVSGLLLTRATARKGELALCRALGAGSFWLFRNVFLEAFVLALAACVLGVGLASVALRTFVLLGASILPGIERARMDSRTLIFAMAIASLTALCSSIVPGSLALQRSVAYDMQAVRRGASSRSVHRFSAVFLAVQFALTLVLLTGSGLILNSFIRLALTPMGFDPQNVLLTQIEFPEQAGGSYAIGEILAHLRTIPGVTEVSVVQPSVMTGGIQVYPHKPGVKISKARGDMASVTAISPEFFRVLRIPILEGRAFAEQDLKPSMASVIVNEATARRLWPGEAAIGRELAIPISGQDEVCRVVGVAGATHLEGALYPATMQLYLPYTALPRSSDAQFLIRTTGKALPFAKSIRGAIYSVDPNQPVESVMTMKDAISDSILPQRFYALLFLNFSIVATVVAAVGLYGLLRYAFATRAHELGVRIALGASPIHIARLILNFGLGAALCGMVAGIAGVYLTSHVLIAFLHNVDPRDLSTFALTPLVFLLVALGSCLGPYLAIRRIDPAVCLRDQ